VRARARLQVAQPFIQMVVDELLGVGREAPSTGANALRVAAALDAALLSFYGNDRAHGFWERWRPGI
jgi:hypothetical protein